MIENQHMGTHLSVPSVSYPMNANMTGLKWFSKYFAKVASTLEGLISLNWETSSIQGDNVHYLNGSVLFISCPLHQVL